MDTKEHYLDGVILIRHEGKLIPATQNMVPGYNVYGEEYIEVQNEEWRTWDPYRSKFSAAIMRRMKSLPQLKGKKVLYLGAATGTTPSHFSDIVGSKGVLYALEFSSKAAKKLYEVVGTRENMVPLVKDARYPENYSDFVGLVDVVFQDISQPDQTDIFATNVQAFLKQGGIGVIAIKSQSIDSSKKPHKVYREQEQKLKNKYGFKILERKSISKYERAHSIIIIKYGK